MKIRQPKLNLDGTDYCAFSSLRRVSRSISSYYEMALRPAGLRPTGFTILVAIAKSQPLAIGALAGEVLLDPTTMTRSLQFLQRKGLVVVSARSLNRRRFVTLTPKGQSSLSRAIPYWRRAQKRLINKVGVDFWKTMQKELERVTATATQLTAANTRS